MGQSSTDTLKQIASGKALYSTRSSAQCSEMTWARVTGGWQVVQQKVKCLRTVMDEIGEGNGTPLQYSCLENSMDGGAWRAAVHGVAKSQTRRRNFPFTFHFHALEKEMATHSRGSLLENPRDGGAWLAVVYGVTQSWT